ncbi:MAG: hypothetical protein LCH51_07910 [Bacteroidetes bacterium]|nr:hypothetical protein [Bacteroidota bacterium]
MFILLLFPVFCLAQKKAKIGVVFRVGFEKIDKTSAGAAGTVSILSQSKSGLAIGAGIGLTKNQLLEKVTAPVFVELSLFGKKNIVAPIGTFQAGYLVGASNNRIGYTTYESKGGPFGRMLLGFRLPLKNSDKFTLFQVGYGFQQMSMYGKNETYGNLLGQIGLRF